MAPRAGVSNHSRVRSIYACVVHPKAVVFSLMALGNITNVAARGGRASVGSLGNVTAPTSSAVRTTLLCPSRRIVVAGIPEIHAETGLLALSSDPKIPGRGVG